MFTVLVDVLQTKRKVSAVNKVAVEVDVCPALHEELMNRLCLRDVDKLAYIVSRSIAACVAAIHGPADIDLLWVVYTICKVQDRNNRTALINVSSEYVHIYVLRLRGAFKQQRVGKDLLILRSGV